MLQAKAAGAVASLGDMRKVISANVQPDEFLPADAERWNEAYAAYLKCISAQ